jgi:hypothetical protein
MHCARNQNEQMRLNRRGNSIARHSRRVKTADEGLGDPTEVCQVCKLLWAAPFCFILFWHVNDHDSAAHGFSLDSEQYSGQLTPRALSTPQGWDPADQLFSCSVRHINVFSVRINS